MIYCNKKYDIDNGAIYAYGKDPENMNGEIAIYITLEYLILTPSNVNEKYIVNLIILNESDISNGIFEQRLSYEI